MPKTNNLSGEMNEGFYEDKYESPLVMFLLFMSPLIVLLVIITIGWIYFN